MDIIKFATFISFITGKSGNTLDRWEVEDIQCKLLDMVGASSTMNAGSVRELFQAMAQGRKIEAIRAYRNLTGDGLKDAKDAVEAVFNHKPYTTSFAPAPYEVDKYDPAA